MSFNKKAEIFLKNIAPNQKKDTQEINTTINENHDILNSVLEEINAPHSAALVKKSEQPEHLGHRQRIRVKFLNTKDCSHIMEYEFFEMMFLSLNSRMDVKPQAKLAEKHFKTTTELLNATHDEIKAIFKNQADGIFFITKLFKEVAKKYKI